MTLVGSLRRYWHEAALALVLALPWLALLMLGIIWLWQGGHVLARNVDRTFDIPS